MLQDIMYNIKLCICMCIYIHIYVCIYVLMCFQTRHFYNLKLTETDKTFVFHFIKSMDVINSGSWPLSPVEHWYQHIVILSCHFIYPRLADCNTHITIS